MFDDVLHLSNLGASEFFIKSERTVYSSCVEMSADSTAIPSGMAIVVYAGERFNKIGIVLIC